MLGIMCQTEPYRAKVFKGIQTNSTQKKRIGLKNKQKSAISSAARLSTGEMSMSVGQTRKCFKHQKLCGLQQNYPET